MGISQQKMQRFISNLFDVTTYYDGQGRYLNPVMKSTYSVQEQGDFFQEYTCYKRYGQARKDDR